MTPASQMRRPSAIRVGATRPVFGSTGRLWWTAAAGLFASGMLHLSLLAILTGPIDENPGRPPSPLIDTAITFAEWSGPVANSSELPLIDATASMFAVEDSNNAVETVEGDGRREAELQSGEREDSAGAEKTPPAVVAASAAVDDDSAAALSSVPARGPIVPASTTVPVSATAAISKTTMGQTPRPRVPIVKSTGKSAAVDTVKAASCDACSGFRKLGTTVDFASSADEAGKLAGQREKLLFLLHVSGNFAREEFT